MFACPATDDFFRSRLDHMIDLRHLGGAGQPHALARDRSFFGPLLCPPGQGSQEDRRPGQHGLLWRHRFPQRRERLQRRAAPLAASFDGLFSPIS